MTVSSTVNRIFPVLQSIPKVQNRSMRTNTYREMRKRQWAWRKEHGFTLEARPGSPSDTPEYREDRRIQRDLAVTGERRESVYSSQTEGR
jgi:hypothetical protein